jgi:sarcosine/dimethylglycine N-methyltransferase
MADAGLQDDARTAESYYDSDDADRFYFSIWGGEDIHIGLYQSTDEPIAQASERTVARMADKLGELPADARVLDLGAGYGGAARWLAREKGWRVTCVNISETQNDLNRKKNAEAGLAEKIKVLHGSFDAPPAEKGAYDVVWSQDAFLHGADRAKIIRVAAEALKPGGHLIFTDPMQAAGAPADALAPILARIHLPSLGSVAAYREAAAEAGLKEVEVEEMAEQLGRHYARVRAELQARRGDLGDQISADYVDRMIAGLGHWVDGAEQGWLTWGIMHFEKPA